MTQFFVKLQNRGLLHLEGPDRHDFLQGLITNDVRKLSPATPLYACLLNAQGKFLHDFFVLEGDGFTLLDCEGGERAQDLYERLLKYRLRQDVQISVEGEHDVYAILPPLIPPASGGEEILQDFRGGWKDPRHPDMGYHSFEKPDLEEKPFEEWDKRRIALTIPDGSRDLVVGKSTMDEGRMDQLNAIDYEKGCYIGQELTARMHYRGLGKKHLRTIRGLEDNKIRGLDFDFSSPPVLQSSGSLLAEGKPIGEMRSSCGDIGLALVRD